MAYYFTWHALKQRLENTALREILFGTFTALTSVFFYRYSMLSSSSPDKAHLINLDLLLLSSIVFLLSATFRYLGSFIYIHVCPALIQIHKDIDELLKKAKDTIVDTEEWPDLNKRQIEEWNSANYSLLFIRVIITISEAAVFLCYIIALYFFVRSLSQFLLQLIHPI